MIQGDVYHCEACGLELTVTKPCDEDDCDLICCEKQMKKWATFSYWHIIFKILKDDTVPTLLPTKDKLSKLSKINAILHLPNNTIIELREILSTRYLLCRLKRSITNHIKSKNKLTSRFIYSSRLEVEILKYLRQVIKSLNKSLMIPY